MQVNFEVSLLVRFAGVPVRGVGVRRSCRAHGVYEQNK